MRLRGAIFDFDGTLFDTMAVWDTAGEDYLWQIGMTPKETINEELKAMSLKQAAETIREQYRISKSTETIIDEVNEMVGDFYLYRAEPKLGIREFLEQLEEQGVSMCITTAVERRLVEGALKRCGMDRFFGKIFTCGEVGHGKDEPMIYEQALSFLGTEKTETVVFEDAYHAARTAKDAGFLVAAVYDDHETNDKALRSLADWYLEDYRSAECGSGGKHENSIINRRK